MILVYEVIISARKYSLHPTTSIYCYITRTFDIHFIVLFKWLDDQHSVGLLNFFNVSVLSMTYF